ncbi:hypothetical protein MTR67_025736 [Solanum verrucosum]|uniref:Uncharacterized protein n=1 Tax=Solanum verrucosum TaxID=315347 RepID=A0AAF0R5N9_SOLVR|nr:hypothetical protein MTR67_025736 [Solanum verrucosum]
MMQSTSCNHRYCEECIQNYIGKKINKDIHEIISKKCPASDCNGILDIDSIMPVDFLMRVRDAIRLTEVLATPIVIDCPFMDCMGTLVDDLRECPIRACLECWRLFFVNCKCLHLGMTCENYQISRQLNLLYWQHHYEGYDDELEEKILSITLGMGPGTTTGITGRGPHHRLWSCSWFMGAIAQAPRTTPRAVVLTTGHGGGSEDEAVLAKVGAVLAFGLGLAPIPWLLPSSLDLLHLHLALGGVLDYGVLQYLSLGFILDAMRTHESSTPFSY